MIENQEDDLHKSHSGHTICVDGDQGTLLTAIADANTAIIELSYYGENKRVCVGQMLNL